jgi:hypothetical protein
VAAATGRFELGEPQKDGQSLETHLISYYRQTGEVPEQLLVEPIPFELTHVWQWWHQLHATRSIGNRRCHITYAEVHAWATVLQLSPAPFEIACLMAVDTAYMQWHDVVDAKNAPKTGTP